MAKIIAALILSGCAYMPHDRSVRALSCQPMVTPLGVSRTDVGKVPVRLDGIIGGINCKY